MSSQAAAAPVASTDHRFRRTAVSAGGAAMVLPRYRPRPLTCLGDAAEIGARGASCFDREMPPDYSRRYVLRKWWEWDYLAKCAEELGLLEGPRSGVGLGVGDEPLIFYFANRCRKIIATDLYSDQTSWREARFRGPQAVYATAPIPFPRRRVEIRNADMRDLGIPAASVDFAWSCSSIEHVPTLADLLAVFDELARVLKVGGYALLTTEFCLTEPPYLLPGVNAWDADLLDVLRSALGAFEFVGDTDLSYNFAHPANAAESRRFHPAGLERCRARPPCRFGQMANLGGLSVVAPVGCVLRRRAGSNAGWNELPISAEVRAFSEAVTRVQAGEIEGVADALRPLVCDGPRRTTPQFYHLAFRFYIEAMARDADYGAGEVLREIREFLGHLPGGVVQDADCLDLVGYLLDDLGQHDEAAYVYRLALDSPSTSRDQIAKLAFDYCHAMRGAGRFSAALDAVAAAFNEMADGGVPGEELRRLVAAAAARSRLGEDDLRRFRAAVDGTPVAAGRDVESDLGRWDWL